MKAVLVVDDLPEIRGLLARIFSRRGFTVIEAGSLGEAKKLVASGVLGAVDLRYAFVDINLTDNLESREGLDVIGLLVRAGFDGTPVIAMSGIGENKRYALELGADAFIAKPFGLDEVLAQLTDEDRALPR